MSEQPFDPSKHLSRVGGKEYLEVKWRLVWLRDQHADAEIATECLESSDVHARFRAIVVIPGAGSACGHGSETRGDFPDFYEKAETKAVGRALAMLGYGTQFAPELEEGERIVDAPVRRGPAPPAERQRARQVHPAPVSSVQWPRPIPGKPMSDAQLRRLMGPIRSGQNMTEEDVRAQVFLRYGHEHIHDMSVPECSELMDLLERGDHLTGSVPPQARADPQEANQRGMDGMPEEPRYLRDYMA